MASFTDLEYATKKKKTRKELFLAEMDALLPWKQLLQVIRPHYPKLGNGRPPFPLDSMLRIYFMQQWYGLSDPAMEDSLYDITSMRLFAKLSLEQIPDESTILRFRHLLESKNLTKKLFNKTQKYLVQNNLIIREGAIVDATFITASSSTKNKERKRDPEMKSGKKGNTWHFGMKVHVATDTQGIAHGVSVTDASVHDSQEMDDLLHGDEKEVYGDKAYSSGSRKATLEAKGVTCRINRKASRGKKLTCADRSFNKKSNRTRARVEHIFGVVKHLWGYRKVRYRGLKKNAAQVYTLITLANLYMVRKSIRGSMG